MKATDQIIRMLREMRVEDQGLARAIFDAEDQVTLAALIRDYYRDLDRADRTPRGMLYVHIGMLVGILDRWQRGAAH